MLHPPTCEAYHGTVIQSNLIFLILESAMHSSVAESCTIKRDKRNDMTYALQSWRADD